MRKAIAAVAIGGLLLLLADCGKSDAEKQADCLKAITEASTVSDRPEACQSLSDEDYKDLLIGWTVDNAIDEMPEEDQDILDLYDDGSVNGSID